MCAYTSTICERSWKTDPANPKYILTERGVGYRFIDYRRKDPAAATE